MNESDTPRTDLQFPVLIQDGVEYVELSFAEGIEKELTAARQEIDILKSKYADHHAEAERLTSEIRSITEQRDELLRYNEAFRKETLICADCDAIRKEEYDQAIEQRDRLAEAVIRFSQGTCSIHFILDLAVAAIKGNTND
jgi:hypothetical protein